MDVYLLRHGKAEKRSPSVKSDSRRELTEAGRTEMEQVARAIKNMRVRFDHVISSPLLRARQTSDIIFPYTRCKKRSVAIWSQLRPESDAAEILKKLAALKPDATVMLVGHEPVLSSLIGTMISAGRHDISITLRKGGLAHVECTIQGAAMVGTLQSIQTPKQLRRMRR